MEINNFNEKFWEIGKKYTLNQIDKNGDGVISQDEVLYLIEKDEEVESKLDISQLESVENGVEVKNNSLNYEGINSVYQQYLKNVDIVEENTRNGKYSAKTSLQLDINEKPLDVPLSLQYWNGEKENDKWNSIKINEIVDINQDGEVSFADINLIPEEMDLNGDGEISNEEKLFLKKLKVRLYVQLKNKTMNNIYKKTAKIDDIIEYLTINANDDVISNVIKSSNLWLKSQGAENSGKQFVNENSSVWSGYGISAQTLAYTDNIITKYLLMVDKTDLSKSELEDILNKINSASAKTQSQLAEVKTVVEQKLEALK